MSQIMPGLTGLDYVIGGILFISLLLGLIRGFTKEIISLLAWIAAFFAAIKFSPDVDMMLHSVIPHAVTRYIVSIVLIFLVVLIAGCLLNKIIHAVLKFTGFGFFDRLLGLIFGGARGVIIVTIILLAISLMPSQNAAWVKESKLAPHFAPLVDHFSAELPADLKALKSASLMVRQLIATHYATVLRQAASEGAAQ
ncbi:MAG: CvpA family protein [Coxiellaceae bacterium]|nr:CvpA family protein [Coxiellaceae bacterium]